MLLISDRHKSLHSARLVEWFEACFISFELLFPFSFILLHRPGKLPPIISWCTLRCSAFVPHCPSHPPGQVNLTKYAVKVYSKRPFRCLFLLYPQQATCFWPAQLSFLDQFTPWSCLTRQVLRKSSRLFFTAEKSLMNGQSYWPRLLGVPLLPFSPSGSSRRHYSHWRLADDRRLGAAGGGLHVNVRESGLYSLSSCPQQIDT